MKRHLLGLDGGGRKSQFDSVFPGMSCHPEQSEGSPRNLSQSAQIPGDSSLPHLRLHAGASVSRSHRTGVLR